MLFWARPDASATPNSGLYAKEGTDRTVLELYWNDATKISAAMLVGGNEEGQESVTGTLTLGAWQFIAMTSDLSQSLGSKMRLYVGSLSTPISEVSYETPWTWGSNFTSIDDASGNWVAGNRGEGGALCWDGDIAFHAGYNRILTLAEMRRQQFSMVPVVENGLLVFTHYGFNGTGTQADWSGNLHNGSLAGTGTVAVSPHVPLPVAPFSIWMPKAPTHVPTTVQFSANCQAATSLRSAKLAAWGRTRTVPQNLIVSAGSVIGGTDGLETATDWSVSGGSASDNTSEYNEGSQSLRLTMNGTANTLTAGRSDLSLDLSGSDQLRIGMYMHDTPSAHVRVVLSNNIGFTQTATVTIPTGTGSPAIHEQELIPDRWVNVNLHRSEFTLAGGFSWSSTVVGMRLIQEDTAQAASVSFDDFRSGVETMPAVILQTDDCYNSDYSVCYQEGWVNRRIRTVHFVISGIMGTSGRLTTAQAVEMFNDGLDIGNHSDENAALTGYATQADVEQHLQNCIDYLFNNEMCRAEYHLAYPQGAWSDTVKAACAAVGMNTARNAYDADVQLTLPQYYWYHTKATPLERDNTTLAEAQGYVDDAIARNEIALIYTHDLGPSPSYYGWDDGDYASLLDYIVQQDITVLTVSDLWALTTGSIVVPATGMVQVIAETIQGLEGALRPRALARLLGETVQASESLVRLSGLLRQITETIQESEMASRVFGFVREIAETVQASETIARLSGLLRLLGETVQVGELTARARSLIRQVAETAQLAETVVRVRALVRRVDETLNLSETIVRVLSGAGGIVRVISETVQASETAGRVRALVRLLGETINLSEARARLRSLVRQLAETVQGAESTLQLRALMRRVSETLNLSEGTARARSLIRRITESVQVSEAIVRVLSSAGQLVRIIAETVQSSERVARARVLARVLSESISLEETTLRARALVRALAESVQASETTAGVTGLLRAVAEAVQTSEAPARVMGFVRTVAETVSLSEGQARIRGLLQWIGETVQLSDTSGRARALVRQLAETVQAGEATARARALVRVVAEALSLAEATARMRGLVRQLTETLSLAEGSARVPGFVRVVSEGVSIIEGLVRTAVTVVLSAARTYIVPLMNRSHRSGSEDRTYEA